MRLAIICLLLAGTVQAAQPSDWISITHNEKGDFDLQAGTGSTFQNKAGLWIASARGRLVHNGSVDFWDVAVTRDDCLAGAGNVWAFYIGGNGTPDKWPFVIHGGTNAAVLAEALCYAFTKGA